MSAKELARLLKNRQYTLIFTGAGISTRSGIPDFRGPQGLWQRWRPVYYHEFMSSQQARIRHWEYKLEGWRDYRLAKPNSAHRALAELDRMGHLHALITQNIDGLHQLAGHPQGRVIELHGTNREIECQSCHQRVEPQPVFEEFERTRVPPICQCGGFLKPATISFGQTMPYDKLSAAFEAAQLADLVLSIGSTLEVEPAASVPRTSKEKGATYVIINQGPTAHDHWAHLKIEGDATAILPDTVRELYKLFGQSPAKKTSANKEGK